MGYEPTDDNVLIHLMFPSLAPDYLRGPQPKGTDHSKPEPVAVTVAADPPTAAAPEPMAPAPLASAEFEVEVEGEVFKVRVKGAGMTVTPSTGASDAGSTTAPPKIGEGT